MKRLMAIFVLAAVISSLLIGCVTPGTKVYNEPSETIKVKVGQGFIIALEENPTTGYSWQEEFDASFLELLENKYEPSAEAKEGVVGAGGTRSLEFKGLKKGKTEVTLVLKRAWEEQFVERKVFTIAIS
jgi:inhibitor of cysteine peptidase